VAPVRAALLSVKGVTRARVTLEGHAAVVTFDPNQATVDDLIKAVHDAEGGQFTAKVKPEKPPKD
jgi:copper chaperone CopZ